MSKEDVFRGAIRLVFLSAYGAFLWASIHHVAAFFHSFEEDPNNWSTPYWLAGSIDITALVLTIGMMFFRRGMPWWAQTLTWGFIISLTGFSWFVNWEYAILHMSPQLASNPRLSWLRDVNPIMASAFAFLNLAYSLVAEFFSAKKKTLAEIQAEIDERNLLEASKTELADIKADEKIASIARIKKLGSAIKGGAQEQEKPAEIVPPVHIEAPLEFTPQEPEIVNSVSFPEWTPVVDESIPESELECELDTELDTEHEFTPEPRPSTHEKANKDVDKSETAFPSGEASRRVQRILKSHPEFTNAEIAKRAKVTPSYVGKIRKLRIAKSAQNGNGNGHRKITQNLIENLVEVVPDTMSKN